jgi:hypothetical protein
LAENKGSRVQKVRKSPQGNEKTLFRCGIAQEFGAGEELAVGVPRELRPGTTIMRYFTI